LTYIINEVVFTQRTNKGVKSKRSETNRVRVKEWEIEKILGNRKNIK